MNIYEEMGFNIGLTQMTSPGSWREFACKNQIFYNPKIKTKAD